MNITVLAAKNRCQIQASVGENLMDCLRKAGILEGTECGGRGVCGKCAVRVHSGSFTPLKEDQPVRADGKILACLHKVSGDAVIEVSSAQDDINRKVRLPNLQKKISFTDQPVKKIFLQMAKPSLHDQLCDLGRILSEVGWDIKVPHALLTDLPETMRASDFMATAVLVEDEIIAVEPGDTTAHSYGFVLDVGTTTVAIYLVNLIDGDVLDAAGIANPQRDFGADVLSRISASATREKLCQIHDLTIKGISRAMCTLLERHGISRSHVYTLVMVGNTTMSHLFLQIDPSNLAVAPFIPCHRPGISLKGRTLGLPMHPEGHVHVLANISGYVGSDTLGVAMATRLWEQEGYSLAVDIGTNGEIILGYNGELMACSAAAGPAFEGSHIQQGMRAGDGAIEKVSLADDSVHLAIIGKSAPVGICGSGLIDAVAELLRVGLLERTGKFVADGHPAAVQPLASRLRVGPGGIREFVLVYAGEYNSSEDVVITQKDIRELQLAKAAIAAGIQVLLTEAGINAAQVDRLFLAGAFGNYLDKEKAVALGIFPGIPADKIISIGNAAAEGAAICLLSCGQRETANRLAKNVKPIELSTRADFNDLWVRAIAFPNAASPVSSFR